MSTAQTTARVAVITGASSGIGEATARALAADGHSVALLARRADRIRELASELGNGAAAIQADVTDRESIVAAAKRVQEELGGADVLVNNAGVMLTAPFTSHQREEHRRMVETNLLGAMTVTERLPRPASRRGRRRPREHLVGRRPRRSGRLRRLSATKWDQRLVRSPTR
jgi:NADP-dependent 3-hydroxy acid dehydrogenase YdfG